MIEFSVIKTIELIYTVEAKSYEDACSQVKSFGFIEADQFSTVSILCESNVDGEFK